MFQIDYRGRDGRGRHSGMAALSTVLLVLASRRATLRQINASLLEISEQLKQLRMPAPGFSFRLTDEPTATAARCCGRNSATTLWP